MNSLNHRTLLPVMLLLALATNAAPKLAKPFFNKSMLINSVKNLPVEQNTAKICACQLLDVKSNNEDLQNLVIFAEKTNNGDLSNVQHSVLQVLNRERKSMKIFYSSITVKREIVMPTDCASLYLQLKGTYENIKFFQLFDADIRNAVDH